MNPKDIETSFIDKYFSNFCTFNALNADLYSKFSGTPLCIYIYIFLVSLFTTCSCFNTLCFFFANLSKPHCFKMSLFLCFSFLLFFVSSVTACDRCVHQTKAAYFSKASALNCEDPLFGFSLVLLAQSI